MKFLDIRTDFAFKKVFGSVESKGRLISFLNSIIYADSLEQIIDLEIVDPYNIPMLKGMKDSFVDVKALLNNKSTVIIEMQVLPHVGFEKRILYNMAKNYSTQLVKGEQYQLLNPIIALTIVDFDMFPNTSHFISRFKLRENETFIKYSDDLEMVFVELPKFTKSLGELKNIEDEWIWFVKNAGSLEYIPNEISEDVKGALEIVNEATMSLEELEIQKQKKDFIFIQAGSITLAHEKGREEGREEGMEKGRRNAMVEVATSLLGYLDDAIIAKQTKLSVEEVSALRNR